MAKIDILGNCKSKYIPYYIDAVANEAREHRDFLVFLCMDQPNNSEYSKCLMRATQTHVDLKIIISNNKEAIQAIRN